jgi:serpin B
MLSSNTELQPGKRAQGEKQSNYQWLHIRQLVMQIGQRSCAWSRDVKRSRQTNRLPVGLLAPLFAFTLFLNAGGSVLAVNQNAETTEPIGNKFAFGFFSAVDKDRQNVLLSPLSAFLALSMTFNGAAGETEAVMAKALGISDMDKESLNKRNQSILTSFRENPTVQIANAIFADNSTPIKAGFLEVNKKFYGAEAVNLPFRDPGTVGKINGWVSANTHGKIPSIIEKLSPRDKMVLLNAIYFKGKWNRQFDKGATDDQTFHLLDAGDKKVKMMHQQASFMYCKQKNFQAVVLPYSDKKLSMYVILPDQGSDFKTFVGSFHQETFNAVVGQARAQSVKLSLPQFKVNYSIVCNEALAKLGMGSAFGSEADFTHLFSASGGIDQVIQKTYMDVNEEGTEAAAVTAVTMFARSAFHDEPINFVVDRPFIVAIRDDITGEILFLGSIVDPS